MTCPHNERCPMFKVFQTKTLLRIWVMRYCASDRYPTCERYILAATGAPVPRTLLPNGQKLAEGRAASANEKDVMPLRRV